MDGGVGKTLREARERHGVGLAEVEASTKIRQRYLRALEAEEWDALPGEAYARAFIRAYAAFLGLDGAELASRHRDLGRTAGVAEGVPRVEPRPVSRAGDGSGRRGVWVGVGLLAAFAAAVIAVGISNSGGGSPEGTSRPQVVDGSGGGEGGAAGQPPPVTATASKPGTSLQLTATAEVWVCVLDAGGEPVVDGLILASGTRAGPFRSGSFTVSLGNGEVSMTVNGQQASIPPTPSPVGYRVDPGGSLHELAEGERPTCT